MNNSGRYFGSSFRTGARSGIKRSPRTSTSLEVIVVLWFYHWLLEGGGVAVFEEAAY